MKRRVRKTVGMGAEGGGHRMRSQRCASTTLEACPVCRAPQRRIATAIPSPTGHHPVQWGSPRRTSAHAGRVGIPKHEDGSPDIEHTPTPRQPPKGQPAVFDG